MTGPSGWRRLVDSGAIPAQKHRSPLCLSDASSASTSARSRLKRAAGLAGRGGDRAGDPGVPALLAHGPTPRKPFDEQPVRLLTKARPEVVFLAIRCSIRGWTRRCSTAWPAGNAWCWRVRAAARRCVPAFEECHRGAGASAADGRDFFRERQLTLPAHRASGITGCGWRR